VLCWSVALARIDTQTMDRLLDSAPQKSPPQPVETAVPASQALAPTPVEVVPQPKPAAVAKPAPPAVKPGTAQPQPQPQPAKKKMTAGDVFGVILVVIFGLAGVLALGKIALALWIYLANDLKVPPQYIVAGIFILGSLISHLRKK